ncbi:MAG: DUF2079 domain-containing protein, partial [Planctomycetaceae bacterium]|nr:DUF2079 domain-containing protein [Planctomycetaceae bacterium]
MLTEPRLNDAFWPRDIGDRVVAAFGGTADVRVAGDRRIELGWISVVLRFGATLILAATANGLWASRRSGELAGTGVSSRFVSGFISTMTAIARPWILAGVWLIGWILGTSVSSPEPLNFLQLTTPLAAALIGALSVNGFCNSTWGPSKLLRAPGNSVAGGRQGYSPLLILIVAAVCWEGMSFWMNERLYAGLLVPHGDSAMYEEHLWNVWHGKGFRSYLDQGLFLGEHIQVIHLLLLPLHYLWPSYLMLELVASCSLASCVIPIFLIARRHSGSSRAALWLGLAWLLFFPMHYLDIAIDLKTLRPSCYGLPFLFWGIDFAERRRLFSSSICFLIALTTQEDFALVAGSIGVVLFLLARKKSEAESVVDARRFSVWSVSLVLFSVAWVLLAVLVVIPAFRGGDAVHYSRYFGELGSSPGDLVRSALRTPGKVLSQLFSLRTLFYVLVLTAPLGLRPLRKPMYLISCAATFCMLSLIQLGNSVGATNVSGLSELPPIPYHHFHAPLLPVLFWAAAASLRPPGGVSAAR